MINIVGMHDAEIHYTNSLIECASLMGSRGRANLYKHDINDTSDYDYVIFVKDNLAIMGDTYCHSVQNILVKAFKWKRTKHEDGSVTVSKNNIDISVRPESCREKILKAWALQEEGMSKEEAWKQVEGK